MQPHIVGLSTFILGGFFFLLLMSPTKEFQNFWDLWRNVIVGYLAITYHAGYLGPPLFNGIIGWLSATKYWFFSLLILCSNIVFGIYKYLKLDREGAIFESGLVDHILDWRILFFFILPFCLFFLIVFYSCFSFALREHQPSADVR
jgi:hypothetical protein